MTNWIHKPKHVVMKRKKNKAKKSKKGKKLIEKAGLAIKNEFYLEAAWILSTLFEQKLCRILDKLEPAPRRGGLTFAQLIKSAKYLHVSAKYPELTQHFNVDLIDEIRNWKNQRNEILKDLPDIHVSQVRMERLSTEGVKLYKVLNKSVKSFNPSVNLSDSEDESNGA
jgi:hypothetical protein